MKKQLITLFCFLLISLSIYPQWINIQIEKGVSPKNDIRSICFDLNNQIWVGTSNGVYKEEQQIWQPQGVEGVYIESLHIDRNDVKRAGVWGGGVYKSIKTGLWEKDEQASLSMSANAISSDSIGNIWVGTWGKGVVCIDRSETHNYTAQKVSIGDNSILSFACAANGTMWVGSYHGVSSFDGKQWALYNRDNSPLPNNDIYSLATRGDNVWIGTCSGVALLKNGKWRKTYTVQNSIIPSNVILSLAVDNQNRLWVGTPKGLVMISETVEKKYTTENSNIIDNRIQTIVVRNNQLYVGTSAGIAMLDLSSTSL